MGNCQHRRHYVLKEYSLETEAKQRDRQERRQIDCTLRDSQTSQKRLPGKICSVKRAVKDDLDLYCPEFPGENSEKLFQNFQT